MNYLDIPNKFNNPFFPSPVCLGPNIAIKVPMGRDAEVLGIKVTLVLLPIRFVKANP